MHRVYNFGAGPAMLPTDVLEIAQKELLDWHGTGMSVMELGHRGNQFQEMAFEAEMDFRDLMQIPKHYHVLFLSGGASTQFAMVPLNLFGENKSADYIDTGVWSRKAITEATRYGQVNVAAKTTQRDGMAFIPLQTDWHLTKNAAFLHYTPNETIDGLFFHWTPKIPGVPLVADMTSMILSCPINVNDYGVIYAGAQKNIGQAGMTVVIIRNDLIKEPLSHTPTLYQYRTHAEHRSLYNTPPTYCWYLAGLVFKWMKEYGGVPAFYEINRRKAKKLYDVIDRQSGFYECRIHPTCRSLMNVMFYLRDEKLTDLFLKEASHFDLVNLKGHRVSGGVRASIYNAMPEKAIDILADFMVDFAKRYG